MRVGRQHWLLQVRPERRQWLIAMAFVLMLVGSVVGAVPTFMVLRTSGLNSNYFEMAFEAIYAPLIWLDVHVPWCRAFFEAERNFLERMSGR